MNKKILNKRIRELLCLGYSIVFNFHYLPFRQAKKLPILFECRPTFVSLKGKVILDTKKLKTGMVAFGNNGSPIEARRDFRWQNNEGGTIIFKGNCRIGCNSFISCNKGAVIEFGEDCKFNHGTRIISSCKIVFGDDARVSWRCTFIDTDFHPIVDMMSGSQMKQDIPVILGREVWIGHDSIISKGTKIADENIVSSGSVVKGVFKKKNTIIGGNLAKVLTEGYCRAESYNKDSSHLMIDG